jgi:universal stress protein A
MLPPQRVLVPTDFSEFSNRALRQAVAFAEKSRARIYLLHVINRGAQQCVADYCLTPGIMRTIENESIVITDENLKKEIENVLKSGNAEIIPLMRKGFPEEEILKEAQKKNIDMIVIASLGKTGLKRHIIGSVAEKVLKGSSCPVLLVRPWF